VASALLLVVLAFATPKIASALVGGVGNLLGEGASAALGAAGTAVGVVR
jgi:type IV secretory pathway TrbL component